jgi:uncharacterized cupin superfamily protein
MAEIVPTPGGDVPRGTGWYVLNAQRAQWFHTPGGAECDFEGPEERFAEVGVHLVVLQPGEPNAVYHAESHQEGFLVLSGECLAVIEGEEVRLRRWDYFHSPAGTRHVLVGAGEGPCLLVSLGGRGGDAGLRYPPDPVARRHGAAVDVETCDPGAAYAEAPKPETGPAPDLESLL